MNIYDIVDDRQWLTPDEPPTTKDDDDEPRLIWDDDLRYEMENDF